MGEKSEWLFYDDKKDTLKFRVEEDGGFEIEEYNGKPAPKDQNSEEYSTWMFGSMKCVAKVVAELDKKNMIKENG